MKSTYGANAKSGSVAVIVAHPDDETLWAGGLILNYPSWKWLIISLCRGKDEDRAPRFYEAMKLYKSEGIMGDLDDGPEQRPLDEEEVGRTLLDLLPQKHFDLIISHNPSGEYTRHIRHEEVSKAVIKLWYSGRISANELRTFAYEDGGRKYFPKAVETADIFLTLTRDIWERKYKVITETYGFEKNSFEAKTTPRLEAFWKFGNPDDAQKWLDNSGIKI